MFQSWILGFNPENLSNLPFPMWVSLRNMLYGHHTYAIAKTLGEIIGIDASNKNNRRSKIISKSIKGG